MQGDGPAPPRFTPQAGMGMFDLEQVQLFWERSLDTKVSFADRVPCMQTHSKPLSQGVTLPALLRP